MKTLLIYIGLFFAFKSAIGQSSIIGCYGRQDSQIKLNADSTFFFFHAVDTYRGWIKGIWTLKRKKIVLVPKLVYDTITSKNGDLTVDSLILSRDYISDRIVQTNNGVIYVFQYEQCEKLSPNY